MLVSAFAGYDHIMNAYRHAIDQSYRFFSYGDAIFELVIMKNVEQFCDMTTWMQEVERPRVSCQSTARHSCGGLPSGESTLQR